MDYDDVRFLTFEEALAIHDDQIARYGGSYGIRDEGLFRSALAQPEAQFGGVYLHDSIASMAGAYLFHLLQNHPFIDGNKRVGAASAATFLALNGYALDSSIEEIQDDSKTRFETIVLSVTEGRTTKDALRDWIQGVLKSAE